MNGALLPLRESVQSAWRAEGQEGRKWKKKKKQKSKRKRAREREMVFNKQAALYGNVMNTVDKKKGETKVVKFQAVKELQSVFKCHIDFSSNL